MTNEEAIAIIRNEYKCVDRDCDIERNCGKCDLMMPSKEPILEAYKWAIKALEQQPTTTTNNNEPITVIYPTIVCDDAISREAVVQTIEDAKNAGELTFARTIKRIMELPSVTQKPIECDDAISRQAVLDLINADWKYENLEQPVSNLPPVQPQQKYGMWIKKGNTLKCPFCGAKGEDIKDDYCFNYCPNCGTKMQESEEV